MKKTTCQRGVYGKKTYGIHGEGHYCKGLVTCKMIISF